jgi:hypothetical protein
MDAFSYISFLTSVVIALGITRLAAGVGRLFQARNAMNPYWVHTVWTLNVVLFLLMDWWILYRWRTQTHWTFFLFLFVLISPAIGFLLAVLLFPEPMPDDVDIKAHYFRNSRLFFALGALLAPIDVIDTLLKGWDHFLAQGLIYVVSMAVFVGLFVTATLIRNGRFHAFFAVFFLIYLLVFIGINLSVLQ